MSSLLASVARSLTAHWKRGLIGLVVVIALVGVAVGSQSGEAAQDFAIPGTESQKAQDLLESKFPAAAGAQSQVVYSVKDGRIGATQREAIAGVEREDRRSCRT